MTRVFASRDPLLVEHIRAVLEGVGIQCLVRYRDLRSIVGELPFVEAWPEVWVMDDDLAEDARNIVQENAAISVGDAPPWICPACGQSIEPQFTGCWNCEGQREDDTDVAPTRGWLLLAVLVVLALVAFAWSYGR